MVASAPWLDRSVRNFWQGINWENRPLVAAPVVEGNGQAIAVQPSFTLSLSVREYFAAIPWSGVPVVAAPAPAPVLEERKDTLEDFLSDISNFF